MESSSSLMRNPWADDDRSLGSIRNILILAERMGFSKPKVDWSIDSDLREESATRPKISCASIRMIDAHRRIEQLIKKRNKATLEIQCRMQDKETKDLTHIKVLEKRIEKINALNTHLQMIVSRKDELIHRLQQPYVGDFIKIDASHKQYASEVIPMLVPVLSDLSSQLDNFEWASKADILNSQLESLLSEISMLLASLQSNFHSMSQMRHSLQQLHDQRTASCVTPGTTPAKSSIKSALGHHK